jgi:type IX secretion system PorP/SprF family membrane protein
MRSAAIIMFILAPLLAQAQYFQFSQYNFTPQRINPATVASSDYAEATILNRNQSTGGGFHLKSNFFNASYPLMNAKGARWSGIGISLMDDRAAQSGLYVTQEVSLSYAIAVPVSKGTSLSLGFRALHSRRKIDTDGLHTGLQYIPERGFDESQNSGEDFGKLSNSFNTFSAGIFWRRENKKKMPVASAGLAFFDFNKPEEQYLETPASFASSLVASFSYLAATRGKASFYPELLLTLSSGTLTWNGGLVTSYELKTYRKKQSDRLDIITRFKSHMGPLVGIQFHTDGFGVGVSYDVPFGARQVSNHGALEVGLILKRLVEPPRKSRRGRSPNGKTSTQAKRPPVEKQVRPQTSRNDTTNVVPSSTLNSLSDRLKAKQDSVRGSVAPGEIEHEALILEKATLHFKFDFNSSGLEDEARAYLDDVAQALVDNPELHIELTGHTDNVGSARFNLKLSIERARTIRDYLLTKGVHESRIKADGKGLTEPLNENETEEHRALNRRVEMRILYSR